MRCVVVCVATLFLLGCAVAPPKEFQVNPVVTIPGDFDAVWPAVVEYFATTNLPIKTIEKDSGLIVTEWFDASEKPGWGKEDKTLCDCGLAPKIVALQWNRGKFSVFVKQTSAGEIALRVTCAYQQLRTFLDEYRVVNCNSTGYVESQLHQYVMARVTGVATPEVPTFKPAPTTD